MAGASLDLVIPGRPRGPFQKDGQTAPTKRPVGFEVAPRAAVSRSERNVGSHPSSDHPRMRSQSPASTGRKRMRVGEGVEPPRPRLDPELGSDIVTRGCCRSEAAESRRLRRNGSRFVSAPAHSGQDFRTRVDPDFKRAFATARPASRVGDEWTARTSSRPRHKHLEPARGRADARATVAIVPGSASSYFPMRFAAAIAAVTPDFARIALTCLRALLESRRTAAR